MKRSISKAVGLTLMSTLAGIFLAVIAACQPEPSAPASVARLTATPEASTAPALDLSPAELKYRLIHRLGDVFVAEPAVPPHEVRLEQARGAFPGIQQKAAELQAILRELGLEGASSLTDDQKLLVLEEKTGLNHVLLERSGDLYAFGLVIGERDGRTQVKGTISRSGEITVLSRQPGLGLLPVCLSGSTGIATPDGRVAVSGLRVGMAVWTAGVEGERVIGVVEKVGSTAAPGDHSMVRLALDDGRRLLASPRHPLADGRELGELAAGDLVDGARVTSVELAPYGGKETYDLLPSGSTGRYWADGILLGTTLSRGPGCGSR